MTRPSTRAHRAGSSWRVGIAISLLIFLSATIVAGTTTSWPHDIASRVAHHAKFHAGLEYLAHFATEAKKLARKVP
jgi:hypothetical protein